MLETLCVCVYVHKRQRGGGGDREKVSALCGERERKRVGCVGICERQSAS